MGQGVIACTSAQTARYIHFKIAKTGTQNLMFKELKVYSEQDINKIYTYDYYADFGYNAHY